MQLTVALPTERATQLTAQGITHRIRDRVLLDDLDLTVQIGERVAIVGPSGIGKSTLLGILGGLVRPTAGAVFVKTGEARDERVDRRVAWVPQTVNVLPDRTVLDNVALGGFSAGLNRARAASAAGAALGEVGLADFASRPIRQLSGGEVQRVVTARAVVTGREFILADEPTGQLDAATTETVVDALMRAAKSRGLIVVTHDPQVARRCERVLSIICGRLVPR